MKFWSLPLLSLLLMGMGTRASAAIIDGVSVEYGDAISRNADVTLWRVGLQKKWQKQWFKDGDWHVGGYWDFSLGIWDNRSTNRTNSSILDVGLTPTFRLEQNYPSAVSPYLEAAVGFHVLSHASVSSGRRFGSAFQFGDHIGIGACFGPRHIYDVSYRLQHLSNASLKEPNQGINYNEIRLGLHF